MLSNLNINGGVIVQAVVLRTVTSEAQVTLCGICGWTLGQVFVRIIRFSPVQYSPWLSILVYRLGDEQKAVGSRKSGT